LWQRKVRSIDYFSQLGCSDHHVLVRVGVAKEIVLVDGVGGLVQHTGKSI